MIATRKSSSEGRDTNVSVHCRRESYAVFSGAALELSSGASWERVMGYEQPLVLIERRQHVRVSAGGDVILRVDRKSVV